MDGFGLFVTTPAARYYDAAAGFVARRLRSAGLMSLYARRVLFACLLLLGVPGALSAQTDGTFALGLDASSRIATNEGTTGRSGVGLFWRFGHGSNGWGWRYGLSWYNTDLREPIGDGAPAEFGTLRVRPILVGYGYGHRFGRVALNARVMGGYAFNSFKLLPTFDDAYRTRLGATTVTTDASNSLVLRPDISTWIDLGRKIGLNASVGYMVARPSVTVSSSLGSDRRQINADVLTLRIGAVYSIF